MKNTQEAKQNAFKDAFKNKRLYIIGSILFVLGIGVPFLVFGISLASETMAAFPYPYLIWAFIILYILIGWVVGNNIIFSYQKKNASYNDPIPYETKLKAWEYRLFFFLPALLLLVIALGLEIYAVINNTYPFLDGYDFSTIDTSNSSH